MTETENLVMIARALVYLGLVLAATGLVWSTVRLLRTVGWAQIKKTFVQDPPFLMIMLGVAMTILALLLA